VPKADIRRPLDDDVRPRAGDYGFDLRLLGLRHSKLVKCLLEIVEKSLPLRRRYHEMLVRFLHGATGVLLRAASGPADHFRHEIFEACRGGEERDDGPRLPLGLHLGVGRS